MKTLLLISAFISYTCIAQSNSIPKVFEETQSIVSDTLINGVTIPKMSSLNKNPQIDFSKTKLVFNPDKRQLETWNGKEWVKSIVEICQPSLTNDCGGIGGNGLGTKPVLSADRTTICTARNNKNSNELSAIITAAGCNSGAGIHVAWYREDGTGLSHGIDHSKTVASAGTYFARCITVQGEIYSARSNSVTISEYQTPSDSPLLTASLPIIAGNYFTLRASQCQSNSYFWENIGSGQNAIVLPLSSTTYTAFCRNNVCKGNSSSMLLTVLQPTLSANGTEICYNPNTDARNSITLTIINCDGTVTWSNGEITSTILVSPNQTTTYRAICISDDNISVPTNAIVINVTPKPTIVKTAISRLEYRLTTTCSAGDTFLWNTGATTSSIVVPSTVTEEYTAYCKKNGCSSVGKKKMIYAAPLISSNLSTICEGQTLILSAVGCDGTVRWYTGSGTTVLGTNNPQTLVIRNIFSPTVFTYRATCTVGSDTSPYSNIVSINVNIGNEPSAPSVVSVPNPAFINLGKSISLTASGCAKNQTFWGTGENVTSISKTPEETTNYFAYCFNGTCPSTVTNKLVTVVDVPPPSISAQAPIICAGQVAQLTISGCVGTASLWSIPENNLEAIPASHGAGVNVAITESKLFYAKCTNQGVVSDNSEMVLVSFSPSPVITTTPNPAILWEGESVELFATGCKSDETYLWNDLVTSQTFSQIETQDTYHTVKCVNSTCSTYGTQFYVRVCPLLQTFISPINDFGVTPRTQPDPSQVIIASNLIQNQENPPKTKVIYLANNSINLEPGFKADLGTIFTAQIGGCFVRQSEVTNVR